MLADIYQLKNLRFYILRYELTPNWGWPKITYFYELGLWQNLRSSFDLYFSKLFWNSSNWHKLANWYRLCQSLSKHVKTCQTCFQTLFEIGLNLIECSENRTVSLYIFDFAMNSNSLCYIWFYFFSQAFCFELLHPLIRIDPTLRLTKDYVFDELGPAAFDKTSDFKLTEWLASQEDNHRIVIYQCEPELTHWTKLCIRHADVIFILTDPKVAWLQLWSLNPPKSQKKRLFE